MLDAKIQEVNNSSSPGTSIYDITVNSVNAAHLNLREAIVKYENIVEDLENVWESKVCKFVKFVKQERVQARYPLWI